MAIFKRAAKIVESHVNDRAAHALTPEQQLEAAYLQMVEQVGEVKAQIGEIDYALTSAKRDLEDLDTRMQALMQEAEKALQDGDEDRARSRLERRSTSADRRSEVAARVKVLQTTADRLRDALEDLRDQVTTFRDKRTAIDARTHAALAQDAMHKAAKALDGTASDVLDRAAQQAREIEARSELSESIDEQLERLQREKQ